MKIIQFHAAQNGFGYAQFDDGFDAIWAHFADEDRIWVRRNIGGGGTRLARAITAGKRVELIRQALAARAAA